MHGREIVGEALRLRGEEGLGASEVSRRLGLKRSTVQYWFGGKLPKHSRCRQPGDPELCEHCGHAAHRFDQLPREYVYLLGLYLGDGTISTHRRGVHKLRIFLDKKYPGIVEECAEAMAAVMPENPVQRQLTVSNCWEVFAYSKSWPCLFPQIGPGMKYTHWIWLRPWQQELTERWPEALLRGLIQSDGCRFQNTSGHSDTWSAPRYAFTNVSTDITGIFCTACDKLGLRWTDAWMKTGSKVVIYVSRKDDVARMDEFIGPKR